MRTYRHLHLSAAVGLVFLMVAAGCALSKGLFGDDTTYVLPYDEGGTARIPAATASISLIECTDTHKGSLFTLEIDVFESSWRPVYAIEITVLEGTIMQAVECPPGWTVKAFPRALDAASDVLSFSTDSNPIMPGTRLNGFTVLSNTNRAAIRWYPTDKSGILLGKVTRTELACPSAVEPETWGGIKATYR